MKDIEHVKTRRFLKRADLPLTLTIRNASEENVAYKGESEQLKFVLRFEETDKGLVLGWLNARTTGQICNSTDMDDWVGHRITVYHDPEVRFQGKQVGGIRIKAACNDDYVAWLEQRKAEGIQGAIEMIGASADGGVQ